MSATSRRSEPPGWTSASPALASSTGPSPEEPDERRPPRRCILPAPPSLPRSPGFFFAEADVVSTNDHRASPKSPSDWGSVCPRPRRQDRMSLDASTIGDLGVVDPGADSAVPTVRSRSLHASRRCFPRSAPIVQAGRGGDAVGMAPLAEREERAGRSPAAWGARGLGRALSRATRMKRPRNSWNVGRIGPPFALVRTGGARRTFSLAEAPSNGGSTSREGERTVAFKGGSWSVRPKEVRRVDVQRTTHEGGAEAHLQVRPAARKAAGPRSAAAGKLQAYSSSTCDAGVAGADLRPRVRFDGLGRCVESSEAEPSHAQPGVRRRAGRPPAGKGTA